MFINPPDSREPPVPKSGRPPVLSFARVENFKPEFKCSREVAIGWFDLRRVASDPVLIVLYLVLIVLYLVLIVLYLVLIVLYLLLIVLYFVLIASYAISYWFYCRYCYIYTHYVVVLLLFVWSKANAWKSISEGGQVRCICAPSLAMVFVIT